MDGDIDALGSHEGTRDIVGPRVGFLEGFIDKLGLGEGCLESLGLKLVLGATLSWNTL